MRKPNSACPICDAYGFTGPCPGHGSNTDNNDVSTECSRPHPEEVKGGSASKIVLALVISTTPKNQDTGSVAHMAKTTSTLDVTLDLDNLIITLNRNELDIATFKLIAKYLVESIERLKGLVSEDIKEALNDVAIKVSNEAISIQVPTLKIFNLVVKHLIEQHLLPGIQIPHQTNLNTCKNRESPALGKNDTLFNTEPCESHTQLPSPTPFS